MRTLTLRILFVAFWVTFLGLFFFLLGLNIQGYIREGLPEFMGESLLSKHLWFGLHIFLGTVVYLIGLLQFTPYIRNKYRRLHRNLGKVYIVASLLCILSLIAILPDSGCEPCRASQYIVTGLWLVFVLSAYYFIKQRNIVAHQRMMVRSYICAMYFVTIRVVDQYAMGIFEFMFKTEDAQLLASDVFVWFVPLVCCEIYWRLTKTGTR